MEFTMIARSDAACFVGIDLHKDTLTACVLRNWTRHRNGLTPQPARVLHHVKSIRNRLNLNLPGPVRPDAAALHR
jgi:hypothetical protein